MSLDGAMCNRPAPFVRSPVRLEGKGTVGSRVPISEAFACDAVAAYKKGDHREGAQKRESLLGVLQSQTRGRGQASLELSRTEVRAGDVMMTGFAN